MYELTVKSHFSAAHCLQDYPGSCADLHGHNYLVEAVITCSKLNDIGIGIDFREARQNLREILKQLDHTNLNQHPAFREKTDNPSSENLAKYIFRQLDRRIIKPGARLAKIVVHETEGTSASYLPDSQS